MLFVRFAVPIHFDGRFSELVSRQFAAFQPMHRALQKRQMAKWLRVGEQELDQKAFQEFAERVLEVQQSKTLHENETFGREKSPLLVGE